MNELNIGQKLHQFRQNKGLSIRELSGLANLTPSMLSQIERGITNPSINTLRVIADALDVPLYHFFSDDLPQQELVVRAGRRKSIGLPDYEVSYDLLTPDVSGSIEFCQMNIPAGGCSSEALMNHRGEEVALVLAGTVRILVGAEEYNLATGDSVRIPAGAPHRWVNGGGEEVTVLFAVTPPSF